MQIAGIPRSAASRAASTVLSTDRRNTPGIDGTGSSIPSPERTKTGQMKSPTPRLFSRVRLRSASDLRARRNRVAGKAAWVGRIGIRSIIVTYPDCHGFLRKPRVGIGAKPG